MSRKSSNFIDLEDLEDFFEEGFTVVSASATEWSFEATSEEFAGHTVTLTGTELGADGDFPIDGLITGILFVGPDGVIADVDALNIAVSDFRDELDFDEDEDEDEDEDDGHDIHAGDDDDDIHGDDDDDEIFAGGGNDMMKGRGGDDHLEGDDGDDVLKGGGGKDDLDGGAGEDKLLGGGGKDSLEGGSDDDVLEGGGGKDKFIFGEDFGSDVIVKFDARKEFLDFSATGLVFEDLKIDQTKHHAVVIAGEEGTIEFKGLKGHLDESDFLF